MDVFKVEKKMSGKRNREGGKRWQSRGGPGRCPVNSSSFAQSGGGSSPRVLEECLSPGLEVLVMVVAFEMEMLLLLERGRLYKREG